MSPDPINLRAPNFFRVRISDDVLESMTLAAIEAYCLGTGSGNIGLETFAYLWGYCVKREHGVVYHVSKFSLSLAAKRTPDYVIPDPSAAKLKNELITRWSPQFSLIGNFHTHPYQDISEVTSAKGYNFSPDDFTALSCDDYLWSQSNNRPLMMVMTICKLKRVHEKFFGEQIRSNLCRFYAGEFSFWPNVLVGELGLDNSRKITRNTRSPVFLDLNSRFYNMTGDRILES